jgi:hypothetical protein
MRRILLLCVAAIGCFYSSGQDVSPFKNKQLINAQTTVVPGGLDFTIQHRFGEIALDESFYKDFLGFDLPANIRFSLAHKIGSRAYIGVGRTKIGKTIDVEVKYLLTQQKLAAGTPFSIALFHSTGVNTAAFNVVGESSFFGDSSTVFKNRLVHRLDHNTQLIISRAFGERLSLQIAPTLIYHNLVSGQGTTHHTIVLPLSGRYNYSFGGAFLFEYAYKLNNTSSALDNPFSFGVELGTAGHVFQVFVSNSPYIRESNIYTLEPVNFYSRPNSFVLGFNIRRVWWF